MPPLPEFVSTARLFVADVGRHFGLSEDSVSDLKVAVSEACTAAISSISANGKGAPVRISIEPGAGHIAVRVTGPSGFLAQDKEQVKPGIDLDLGIDLVTALFPEATIEKGPDGSVLRLTFPATG
ncbi:MAG: ATP-binding protein [Actinomycetota bacterium]